MAGKKKTTDTSAEKHAGGRPCEYTDVVAAEICYRLSGGESLNKICKDEHMPHRATVMRWLFRDDLKEFCDKYAEARIAQAECYADEMIDISDDDSLDIGFTEDGKPFVRGEHINRSRVKVDTRKWVAERMSPRKYGAKTQHEVTGKDGGALVVKVVSFDADSNNPA